jgi:hypothetical protein
MIFLMAVDAPFDGFIRDLAAVRMMILYWGDCAALGASDLPRSALAPETISADEPPALQSERGRMNLATLAAKQGDGGKQVAGRHQASAMSSA